MGAYHELRARSIASLASWFPEKGLIVDLGCGTGALSLALCEAAPGRRVLAVDHDAARIRRLEKAKEAHPIETHVGALEVMPLPADVAGVALIDVLHYFPEATQDELLARVAAALRPGGVVVLRDPDASAGARFLWNRIHERIATLSGWTRARIGHYRTAEDWASLLRAHGLVAEVGAPARGLYADRVVTGRKP